MMMVMRRKQKKINGGAAGVLGVSVATVRGGALCLCVLRLFRVVVVLWWELVGEMGDNFCVWWYGSWSCCLLTFCWHTEVLCLYCAFIGNALPSG